MEEPHVLGVRLYSWGVFLLLGLVHIPNTLDLAVLCVVFNSTLS